ncbi:MAG: DNA lyase [Nanoarchaeota archaeon]|nr:DNA lyase [Nanoarchaeota archaeon]MBU0977500.1 DNA lyase [Nanoarchaeota archaeon]
MEKSKEIKSRLAQFKTLTEKQKFREFQFCLLTPQSNAQRCWQAVEEISKIKNPSLLQIRNILKTKTRFHNTKAKRVYNSKKEFSKISPSLSNLAVWGGCNIISLRNSLAKTVDGYGLKEASHFLRNVGLSNNQIAILDRHILKNLYALGLLQEAKIKSQKHYLEIEQIFLAFAGRMRIPADELDLHWWSQENGKVFK